MVPLTPVKVVVVFSMTNMIGPIVVRRRPGLTKPFGPVAIILTVFALDDESASLLNPWNDQLLELFAVSELLLDITTATAPAEDNAGCESVDFPQSRADLSGQSRSLVHVDRGEFDPRTSKGLLYVLGVEFSRTQGAHAINEKAGGIRITSDGLAQSLVRVPQLGLAVASTEVDSSAFGAPVGAWIGATWVVAGRRWAATCHVCVECEW